MLSKSATQFTKARRIDPTVKTFVESIENRHKTLVGDRVLSHQERREVAEKVRAPWRAGGPEMQQTQDISLNDGALRARIYIPQNFAAQGVLLYLHGGGWVMFSIDTHDRLMREYAHHARCAVIGLDYSLAPEKKYPHALNDIDACIAWLERCAPQYDLPCHGKLVIGGDSAGGNLALSATLRRRDRQLPVPDGVLLNYAALDTLQRASYSEFDGPPYMLGAKEMQEFWQDYLGAISTEDPYARPMLSDLKGLPQVFMCIAELDILADENLLLKDQLVAAGVEVSSMVYRGATHSFLEAMSVSPLARGAIKDASDWLLRLFH